MGSAWTLEAMYKAVQEGKRGAERAGGDVSSVRMSRREGGTPGVSQVPRKWRRLGTVGWGLGPAPGGSWESLKAHEGGGVYSGS